MSGTPTYRERLTVPLRWWVQATMLLATFWLAFAVALPLWAAWLATGVLAAATYLIFLSMGSTRIELDGDVLEAGGARIETRHIGEAIALDAAETRRVHGVDADARAFLVTRPYLARAVQVPITDAADSTPYWLLSSRHPHVLADALNGRSGAASDLPDPADDSLDVADDVEPA